MTYRTRLLLQSLVVIAAFLAFATLFDGWSGSVRLVLSLLATAGISLTAAHTLSASQRRAAAELSNLANALATGDLSIRPSLAARGELGDLTDALRGVAEQLGARIEALQAEDVLLSAVIESLNEGVIVVNPAGDVVRINRVGRELLDLRDVTLPMPNDRLPRDASLHRAIHAGVRGISTDPTEAAIGGRQLALTAMPLKQGFGGAVVALFDLTRMRRLEQIRRDFVANVSHELRTPLTVVSGFAETLAEDDPEPEQRRQFADAILTHTGRMQRIVDDLLDLSRIESGGWMPQPELLDLRELCAEVLASLAPVAAGKGLELRVEDGTATAAHVDRTALRQILTNLVENSIRHTETGEVIVSVEREDGGAWLRVRDTGTGISPEHLPRIFERFYRADAARTRQRGGTGLGLAIVKHLTESHGGSVEAVSEPGRGTTIGAFFPDTDNQLELLGR